MRPLDEAGPQVADRDPRPEAKVHWPSVFELMGDPTLILDPDHRVIAANRAARALLGMDHDRILGRPCYELFHGTDRPAPGCPMEASRLSGRFEADTMEVEALGKWFLISCIPMFDGEGALQNILHIATDRTESKQLQSDLLLRNRELASLHRLSRQMIQRPSIKDLTDAALEELERTLEFDLAVIFIRQQDQLILQAQRSRADDAPISSGGAHKVGECLCGLAAASGKPVFSRNILEDPRCTWNECKRAGLKAFAALPLISGNDVVGTLGLGSFAEKDYQQQAHFLESVANEVGGCLSNSLLYQSLQDQATALEGRLQDLLRAEQALSQSHQTLRTVLDSMDAAIYVADLETNEIRYMNGRMRELHGGDLVGKTCWRVLYAAAEPCPRCVKPELISKQGEPAGVMVWEDQDPVTERWSINSVRAIRWVDGRLARLQVATDVTRIKDLEREQDQIERALRQSQKMEAIGTLAGGIAHDFNNILMAIMGYTELSLARAQEGSRLHSCLQGVMNGAQRARDLIKQILTFSRRGETQRQPISVDLPVKEALKLLRSTLPSDIRMVQEIAPTGLVLADPTQIYQIVMNLCTNAAQAMERDGGVLTIGLGQVQFDAEAAARYPGLSAGPHVELSVADSGCGIAPELMDSIFDPYFTTKDKGRGTGLGLAVVHGIVKNHGGAISISSVPERGTRIRVWLPVLTAPTVAAEPELQQSPIGGSGHILLVDDEPAVVEVATGYLEALGYSVEGLTDSVRAREVLTQRAWDFDLVITDMTMPDLTGDKLTTELKQIRADLPVLITSGYSKKITDAAARALGAVGLLGKPFSLAELARSVANALASSFPASGAR